MGLSYTREIDRARQEMAHHAADVAHMRREIERLEHVVSDDLAEPVRMMTGLVEQLADRCWDELGDEGRLLLQGLERSVRHLQAVVDRPR